MRIKLTLCYDGTGYSGWQTQPEKDTVQSRVESAVFSLTGETVRVTASGRTDAGVHAVGQVAHFDVSANISADRFKSGLNHFLPQDIRVSAAEAVPSDFHARKSAKKKTYVYRMHLGDEGEALFATRAAKLDPNIDVDAMSAAAEKLKGRHDFAAFRSSGGSAKTSVRTVFDSEIVRRGDEVYYIVCADGFLYNMVRIMTRFIISCGEGTMHPSDADALFKSGDRGLIKGLAPACGLYLYKVEYL